MALQVSHLVSLRFSSANNKFLISQIYGAMNARCLMHNNFLIQRCDIYDFRFYRAIWCVAWCYVIMIHSSVKKIITLVRRAVVAQAQYYIPMNVQNTQLEELGLMQWFKKHKTAHQDRNMILKSCVLVVPHKTVFIDCNNYNLFTSVRKCTYCFADLVYERCRGNIQ